jgi:hypothetical protein
MAEASSRTTIAICSGPLKFGGLMESGVFAPMKGEALGSRNDEVCEIRNQACAEAKPMRPSTAKYTEKAVSSLKSDVDRYS